MIYPVFKYLTWVVVHTATPNMYFYDCPHKGQVVDYQKMVHVRNSKLVEEPQFLVRFICPMKTLDTWIMEDNLRPLGPK